MRCKYKKYYSKIEPATDILSNINVTIVFRLLFNVVRSGMRSIYLFYDCENVLRRDTRNPRERLRFASISGQKQDRISSRRSNCGADVSDSFC